MPTTALSDLERRAIANLSIPRNVTDLAGELRRDPFTASPTEQDAATLLEDLARHGLVVNLGEHEDLAKLTGVVERHKQALTMPDEKARNYVDRLQAAPRAWRAEGDLWLMTEEGLQALQQPVPGVTAAMVDRAILEQTLAEHARAVIDPGLKGSIFDPDGGRLEGDPAKIRLAGAKIGENGVPVATLLPEEYRHWAQRVVDAWLEQIPQDRRAAARKQLRMPVMGGMPGYGNATEDLVQAADAGGTAYGETAPTFMALTTVAVTDADTGTTITRATYTGYADKSVSAADLGTSSNGTRTNANAIIWPGCTAGTSTVIGVARVTSSGGGRLVRYGTCASVTVSTTQTPPQIAAGAMTDTLD